MRIKRCFLKILFFFSVFSSVIFISCKKSDDQLEDFLNIPATSPPVNSNGYCFDDQEDRYSYDSILKPTILGAKLQNHPYSVNNMKQAAILLYGSDPGIAVNAWYMRFKPSNFSQLAELEDHDIDLFDYPLDYELVQEGDYYNDGVTPAEEIPWLYAVVPVNFQTPTGITSELLEQIHVPDDYRMEEYAFLATGNYIDDADCSTSSSSFSPEENNSMQNFNEDCPNPCNSQCPDFDPTIDCPADDEPGGGSGPGPIPSSRIPGGSITVTDDILQANVPVRIARVVARRFLKVQRTFTDNNGNYQFTKSFRNKVTLLVKFKNNNAIIMGLRGARLWQILFPTKINMGRYRGNLSNIPYNVDDNNDARSRGARHWAGATMHNGVQRFRDIATNQNIANLPPNKLRILTTPATGAGSAPMFAKRFISNLPELFVRTIIISQTAGPIFSSIQGLIEVLVNRVDMVIGYRAGFIGVTPATRNSAQMAEIAYHELAHTSHYAKVGNAWWNDFVNAEVNEMINNFGGGSSPYGNGNTFNSPIIALGESWAYHIGHFFTAIHYGANSPLFREQGENYENGLPVGTLNSNLNLLEDFSPLRTNVDPFWWIPQGLYYDLIDDRNDGAITFPRVPLNDNVLNYTNQQFFNALDTDIDDLPGFRVRLLSENANNQAAGVNTIFGFYDY